MSSSRPTSSSAASSGSMQITVGAKTYNVVDRRVKNVRLLPGHGGRVDRTMFDDEQLDKFEERMQALFDE